MERVKWTDDLIDERMAAIDDKFDRQLEELRALRSEMRSGFSELRAEMRTGFTEMRAEMAAIRSDLWNFQRQALTIVAGLLIALVGLLGAFVAAQL
jgi:hypothetical protein